MFNPGGPEMQILFESPDPDAAQLRDLAERRLRFVMRRLTWLVPRARLHLSDVNGPRGGVDKRCQVELRTNGHGTVVITAMASDWRAEKCGGIVNPLAKSRSRLPIS